MDYRRAQDINRYPLHYGDEEQAEATKVPRRDYPTGRAIWWIFVGLVCLAIAAAIAHAAGVPK